MEWGENCRRPWQVALGLCDRRLSRERIHIIRCDIENLIKLPQGFGKTTQNYIEKPVLAGKVGGARVESLGFGKVGFAPVPLTAPPRNIGQRFRNLTAIGQKRSCLLKITLGGVVIL